MRIIAAAALFSALTLTASLSQAGARGDYVGRMPTRIANAADCPLLLTVASVVDDTEYSTGRGVADVFTGGTQEPKEGPRWHVGIEVPDSTQQRVVAFEFIIEAYNAFDELVASRPITRTLKRPLRPGKGKGLSDIFAPLSDDVSSYRIWISRVRFEDGTIWAGSGPVDVPAGKTIESEEFVAE